ncbi:hypothetical protein HLH17_04560 [Acinetobacter sp. ANC 5380]|uniref:O-antigen ligase domain-containing protein n=1 Tax=Acinetobacter terrae TaxID=2731247 RepID=A0A7Y2WA55_9GAMM|nr:hypothetical protein [Acinetobacter terrae]NNH76957.1 hypothetical protein [Acinetobacter terrae]
MVDKLLHKKSLIYILFGFISALKISFLGEIFIGELASLFLIIPILLFRNISRDEILFVGLAISWFFLQIISDFFNQINIENMIKGVLTPVVFFSTLIVHLYFFKSAKGDFLFYLMGFFVNKIVYINFLPNEYQIINSWKFGLGAAFLNLGVLFFCLKKIGHKENILILTLIIFFVLYSFLSNSRSIATIPIIGVMLFYYSRNYKGLYFFKKNTLLKIIIPVIAVFLIVNVTANYIFSKGLIAGILPAESEDKFKAQATSDIGLILAGRTEFLVSINALKESPFIGHGSWAQDVEGKYNFQYNYLRYISGSVEQLRESETNLIPSHSFIMGAAVWFGLGGIVIWLLIINRVLKAYFSYNNILPLYFHIGIVFLLWDFLFSPFGAESRWYTALFVASLLAYIYRSSNRKDFLTERSS